MIRIEQTNNPVSFSVFLRSHQNRSQASPPTPRRLLKSGRESVYKSSSLYKTFQFSVLNNGRQIYSSPSPRLKMHLVNTGQNWPRRIQISAKHPRRKMFCMPLRILCILCSQISSSHGDSKAWCLHKTSHFRKVKAVPACLVRVFRMYNLCTCVRGEGKEWRRKNMSADGCRDLQ